MIVNETVGKLEIVQNIAKLFFQFVIKIKIYLLWGYRLKAIENLVFDSLSGLNYCYLLQFQIFDLQLKTFNL